ncbi:MAG: beta-lactamase, partial [Acidobacteria bacterium]|nr:beta-lactamase [Acidobacteriota bacterium]
MVSGFLFFALAHVLAAGSVAAAQPVDPAAVDRIVSEALRVWHVPGASVAIVQNDRVVYARGYGVKELGGPAPITADTLFHIGSTTKAFTTTAMAMLVDEKKLDWDDPVRKHVEYFHLSDPCADSLVTLRDITSHRTGLSRHDELWDNTPLSREQIIRSVASVKLTKPFRSAYQYQNIMFLTAGEAVASAAKMPWNDFVRTRIFEPLGMSHTRVTIADWKTSDHATGHRLDKSEGRTAGKSDGRSDRVVVQTLADDDNIAPAGAIKSSARDMAQWIRLQLGEGMFEGKRLVSASALNETHMPQTVIRLEEPVRESNPETLLEAYGLGWVVQDYRGELLVSHGGALNGFRAHVDLLPKQQTGFVVLINVGRSSVTAALRNSLLDLLLGKPGARDWNAYYQALEKKSDDKDEAKKRERDAKRHPDTKPSRELAAYAGTYTNPAYGTATIAAENGTLILRWMRLAVPLIHYQYDTFTAHSDPDDLDEQLT